MYLSSLPFQTGKAGESVGRAGDELPGFPPFLTDTASPICISQFLYLFFNISGISQLLCPAIDILVFGVEAVTWLLSFTLPTGATPESCIFNFLTTLFQSFPRFISSIEIHPDVCSTIHKYSWFPSLLVLVILKWFSSFSQQVAKLRRSQGGKNLQIQLRAGPERRCWWSNNNGGTIRTCPCRINLLEKLSPRTNARRRSWEESWKMHPFTKVFKQISDDFGGLSLKLVRKQRQSLRFIA